MAKKGTGLLVKTSLGKGIVYYADERLNGKLIVALINEDMSPKLDEKNKPIKLLCKDSSIEKIGHID